jgi:hypothetical protein
VKRGKEEGMVNRVCIEATYIVRAFWKQSKYDNADSEINNSLQAALFELKVIYSHTALIFDYP